MLKYDKSNHGRVRAGAWSQNWKLYIILATEELFANIEIFRDCYTFWNTMYWLHFFCSVSEFRWDDYLIQDTKLCSSTSGQMIVML